MDLPASEPHDQVAAQIPKLAGDSPATKRGHGPPVRQIICSAFMSSSEKQLTAVQIHHWIQRHLVNRPDIQIELRSVIESLRHGKDRDFKFIARHKPLAALWELLPTSPNKADLEDRINRSACSTSLTQAALGNSRIMPSRAPRSTFRRPKALSKSLTNNAPNKSTLLSTAPTRSALGQRHILPANVRKATLDNARILGQSRTKPKTPTILPKAPEISASDRSNGLSKERSVPAPDGSHTSLQSSLLATTLDRHLVKLHSTFHTSALGFLSKARPIPAATFDEILSGSSIKLDRPRQPSVWHDAASRAALYSIPFSASIDKMNAISRLHAVPANNLDQASLLTEFSARAPVDSSFFPAGMRTVFPPDKKQRLSSASHPKAAFRDTSTNISAGVHFTNGYKQFRPSGRSARSGRLPADHDVFEGLPVRQWRQSDSTFGLPPPAETTQNGDNSWPELPMPRDAHLLAPWTQALLREARRPKLARREPESTEYDKGEEEEEAEKEVQSGWMAKKWNQVPRHQEEPEREILAKRRKGLPSFHSAFGAPGFPTVIAAATRKTMVRRSDAEGNSTVYEVLVAEGQTVEGEVDKDISAIEATPGKVAPGTVIEGVGIANAEGLVVANDLLAPTPARRRAPPPKRKKGGPGRKKKVAFTGPDGQPTATLPGTAPSVGAHASAMDVDGATPASVAPLGTEVEDLSVPAGEGDDEEGEDGEEGDDGEGDEDDDREEGELSEPEGTADAPLPLAAPTPAAAPAPVEESAPAQEPATTQEPPPLESLPVASSLAPPSPQQREPSSSPDVPLAQHSHDRQEVSATSADVVAAEGPADSPTQLPRDATAEMTIQPVVNVAESELAPTGEGDDLLSSLERHLD